MPRVNIPITQASRAGTALPAATAGDPTNGHTVANGDGRTGLLVRNTGVAAQDITFLLSRKVDGLAVTSRVESVPAGETQLFGPFAPADYGTSLQFDVASAELTINVIRI